MQQIEEYVVAHNTGASVHYLKIVAHIVIYSVSSTDL